MLNLKTNKQNNPRKKKDQGEEELDDRGQKIQASSYK